MDIKQFDALCWMKRHFRKIELSLNYNIVIITHIYEVEFGIKNDQIDVLTRNIL